MSWQLLLSRRRRSRACSIGGMTTSPRRSRAVRRALHSHSQGHCLAQSGVLSAGARPKAWCCDQWTPVPCQQIAPRMWWRLSGCSRREGRPARKPSKGPCYHLLVPLLLSITVLSIHPHTRFHPCTGPQSRIVQYPRPDLVVIIGIHTHIAIVTS